MRNLIRALRGKPVQLSPKQEAKMAAAQARADAMIAKAEADGRAAQLEAAQFMAGQANASVGEPGRGSAGRCRSTRRSRCRRYGDLFKQAFEGFRDSVGEMFDDRRGIIDPGPGADLNRPPPELEDAAERARVAAEERAARDAARAPYRAAAPAAIEFTRFGTTGRTQLEDVVARLQATGLSGAPERVFGVYRVPDRFDHNKNGENRAYVEWEIAHAPGALAPAADDVLLTAFGREDHWVARRFGEPSVLDEDVAGTFCARAGLQPEDCLGLTRLLHIRGSDDEHGKSWSALRRRRARAQPRVRCGRPRAAGDDGRGAARAGRAAAPAVPRRDPRLGGGRRLGRARPHAARRAARRRCPTSRAAGRS